MATIKKSWSIFMAATLLLACMILLKPDGLAASAQQGNPLHQEDFEDAHEYELLSPYGSLTTSADELISGLNAVKGTSTAAEAWAEYLKLDRKVALTQGETYVLSFNYKVLAPEGNFFYLYMKQQGSTGETTTGFNFKSNGSIPYRTGIGADKAILREANGFWMAEMEFTAANDGLYEMIWGIQGGGGIVVDDIAISPGTLAQAPIIKESIALEGFEAGALSETAFAAQGSGTLLDGAEAIRGSYSVAARADAQQEWHEYLRSDTDKLKLAPLTEYTVMFKYEIVEPEPSGQYFYVLAEAGASSTAMNFGSAGEVIWSNAAEAELADRGDYGVARMTFTTAASPDTVLKWGIRQGGGIVIDDITVVKGKAVIPTADGDEIGYANVVHYGAVPDDGGDDTAAFKQAIATGKSIYIPAGTYHVSETLEFQNQNLIGSGMFVTGLVGTMPDAKAPILKAGRTSTIADIGLYFAPELITDNEGKGDRVAIYTGAQWSLQRGSTIRNVRIADVGTGIYSPNGAESFSVTYDTLEIEQFSYRGIDFRSDIRTGNVFRNIYLKSSRPHVDIPFAMTGEESEVHIEQLNVEHTLVNTAILLEGVYGLAASTVHIEGVTLRSPGTGYVTLNHSAGSIESLTVYYTPIQENGISLVKVLDGTYDIGQSYKPETAGFLRIGTLHVKGLNDPNAALHGAKVGGLNRSDASGFVFFDRPSSAIGDYAVQLDNYVWYTFQDDQAVYRSFPADPEGRITFEKLGVVRTSGGTAQRPAERLIPYRSLYFDTNIGALLLWNGTGWVAASSGTTTTVPIAYPTPAPTPTTTSLAPSIWKGDLVHWEELLPSIESRLQSTIADQAVFSDTDNHWGKQLIDWFTRLGTAKGYEDGSFKPDHAISRAQFSVMLVRLLGLGSEAESEPGFSDMNGHWAEREVALLEKSGIVKGYQDGSFQPDSTITREQIITIMMRLVDESALPQEEAKRFDDWTDVSEYARHSMLAAARAGIIQGYKGNLRPQDEATRAETLTMLWKLLKLNPAMERLLEEHD
ncbi:hypothetical protein B1748_27990 [Paenibacillus sp. MY03]|uniref:S-layer homology domain-containing protein n=1 Tax=Paenibacillus sp. MY03 TaxID=302980 RepID=UPI000B3C3CDC|nr:S-layer homology domain-containing protein [Paenibacillus sp. MY03]OUS70590.1 hypothetical protein B1748_27990 [Paenibacillus sp. MY03]